MPARELAALTPHLEPVHLAQHVVLHEIDTEIEHVYFPIAGVVSLIVTGEQGEEVDTAIIGNEGMVGLPVFLGTGQMPFIASVQADMKGLRISAAALRQALQDGDELPKILQRYSQMMIVELAQLILCNRVHSLEHRIARWVLQLTERLEGAAPFSMTQEFVAAMVASPRPHVAQILQSLRERGLIDYNRGAMVVIDSPRLEAAACACYRTIRAEVDRLLRTEGEHDVAI